ncbi:hypothetical protein [Methylorubrum zatmanii]|uniref:Uncharacterized protein n=1 Tax=Methylorubrum zatmanii TaxID=29429 RepID=A0ABW1WWA3_9HYPH|nr:hypothetical protein [Methylorubrum zatmanii]MBD8909306.1 hypothetical protein [Methylorubrum zatmanii]
MIWLHKRVAADEVRSITLLFRDQAAAFDSDNRMLLVSVADAEPEIGLWLCLPELDLLPPYYGFSLCSRPDLPRAPTLVAGCPEHFARLFQNP